METEQEIRAKAIELTNQLASASGPKNIQNFGSWFERQTDEFVTYIKTGIWPKSKT